MNRPAVVHNRFPITVNYTPYDEQATRLPLPRALLVRVFKPVYHVSRREDQAELVDKITRKIP